MRLLSALDWRRFSKTSAWSMRCCGPRAILPIWTSPHAISTAAPSRKLSRDTRPSEVDVAGHGCFKRAPPLQGTAIDRCRSQRAAARSRIPSRWRRPPGFRSAYSVFGLIQRRAGARQCQNRHRRIYRSWRFDTLIIIGRCLVWSSGPRPACATALFALLAAAAGLRCRHGAAELRCDDEFDAISLPGLALTRVCRPACAPWSLCRYC